MKAPYRDIKIGDLVEKGSASIKTGPFGTQLKASEYVESGIPVINVRNIGFRDIREEKLEFINNETAARLSSHLLEKDDIVFGRKGAVERHAYIEANQDGWLQGSDCIRLRISDKTVLPRYVSYSFLSEHHKAWMQAQGSHGATMASLNQDIIARIPLNLPPMGQQQKVVSALSKHDDLINNNNRRITILEQMAQSLYREWFVHFRFPGHGQAKFIDSSLEQIPEGWEVKPLKEITTKIGSGATPRGGKGAYKKEGLALIRSLNIYDGEFRLKDLAFIDESQAGKLKNVIVDEGDVLLNITGASVARCCMAPRYVLPARVNQHVAIIRPDQKKISGEFLFNSRTSMQGKSRLLSLAQGGATREALTKTTIEEFQVLIPPSLILDQYNLLARNIYSQKEILAQKNVNLKQQRDMLLPKLISGQIQL